MKLLLIISVALAVCLSGQIRIGNGTGNSSSSGGGTSAGATNTDFLLTRTATVMTINAAATTSAVVNGRVGSTNYQFTSEGAVTLSGTACSATQYWYLSSGGAITMGHNASTCTYTSTGTTTVTIATPITGFPVDSMPLWTTTTVSGAWSTLTGTMDKRAPNSVGRTITCSGGLACTTTGTDTNVDGSAVTASPGGSNTQVQFNDSSIFAGDAGFTYNKTTDTISLAGGLTALGLGTFGANARAVLGQPTSFATLELLNDGGDRMGIQATSDRYSASNDPALYIGYPNNPSLAIPREGGIQLRGGLSNTRRSCVASGTVSLDTIGSLFYTSASPANLDICALDYAGVANWQTLGASGIYTPTLTNVANVAASAANPCQWHRDGLAVTVSCALDVDPTLTATLTQLGISLPIASAIAQTYQVAGTGVSPTIATQSGGVLADVANDRAELDFTSVSLANATWYITFTYRVI